MVANKPQVTSVLQWLVQAAWWRRYSFYGLLGVIGVTVVTAAYPPPGPPPAAPDAPQPMEAPVVAPTAGSPLDEPLRLVALAQKSYADVRDYTCRMVKRERVAGKLQPQNTMQMSVRSAPFSVYFRWVEPSGLAGQEVCYVAGRYNDRLRVRPRGLLGAVGFVTLDMNDPRARATSPHPITEAGIGSLIEQFAAGWERERRWDLTQVRLGEYEFDHHRCIRVETIHPTNPDNRFLHHRDVVYFDKETHLPVRMEAYDWPRHAGDPGDLVEMYSYVGLRCNVGLDDAVFNH
jgi:hypothetical protein